MSDEINDKIQNLGDFSVGDYVWFILKDGLSRQGKVQGFFLQEGREPAANVFDITDQRHRFMQIDLLSKKPLADVKKKKHRKVKEKKERRSTKVF